jgi:type III pantothenate kinase
MIKSAIFEEGRLLHKYSCATSGFLSEFATTQKQFPAIKTCLLASVGDFPEDYLRVLRDAFEFVHLTPQTRLPFENKYTTPQSLGVDRMGLVAAAVKKYPAEPVLVIDSGSCITYDLVTENGAYLGGAIAPGIRMRYRAMNAYTAKLPLLQPVASTELIGDATATSMHSGVIRAMCFEVDGYVAELKNRFPGLIVVLTGGDAHFLRDNLKSDIFAHSNFLLEGLNYILEFNLGRC